MRRRILQSTLFVVAITALVLGGPLAVTTWQLVEDFARADLTSRLEQVAARLDGPQSLDQIDTAALELAVPAGGRLTVELAGRPALVLGAADLGPDPVVEALPLGPGFRLTLAQPEAVVRTEQVQLTLIVLLLVVASVATGTVVATVTARRLAEPLRDVADRAARLGAGDFRRAPERHGIPELDRVSEVLDASAAALAELVQRERSLVGDVSHQLRSRLTALQLRLDELTTHPDPSAREEAAAALEQAERLSAVLDELLLAARAARAAGAEPVDLKTGLAAVVEEWRPALRAAGRTVRMRVPDGLLARVTPGADAGGGGRAGRQRAAARRGHGHGERPGRGREPARRGGRRRLRRARGAGAARVRPRRVRASSTGLGLALARALVEADGGRLELSRARPPVFTVFLPEARAEDVVGAPRPTAGPR